MRHAVSSSSALLALFAVNSPNPDPLTSVQSVPSVVKTSSLCAYSSASRLP